MCYKDNKSDTEKKELNKKKKCGEEVKQEKKNNMQNENVEKKKRIKEGKKQRDQGE